MYDISGGSGKSYLALLSDSESRDEGYNSYVIISNRHVTNIANGALRNSFTAGDTLYLLIHEWIPNSGAQGVRLFTCRKGTIELVAEDFSYSN